MTVQMDYFITISPRVTSVANVPHDGLCIARKILHSKHLNAAIFLLSSQSKMLSEYITKIPKNDLRGHLDNQVECVRNEKIILEKEREEI